MPGGPAPAPQQGKRGRPRPAPHPPAGQESPESSPPPQPWLDRSPSFSSARVQALGHQEVLVPRAAPVSPNPLPWQVPER